MKLGSSLCLYRQRSNTNAGITRILEPYSSKHWNEEIHRFQILFATRATAVIVYSFRNFARGYPPLYDGTRFVMDTHRRITDKLRIMYCENYNHYQPILNLVGAAGTTGYCIPCSKSYWHVEDH